MGQGRVVSALPDYALFRSLPGAGPHLAPRLLAAFGEQREHVHGADELQKYSGIASVTERSGKKSWVHWRWQCPTFLRQTFKWIRVLYRVWQTRAPYDETIYLNALSKRGSPLLKSLDLG